MNRPNKDDYAQITKIANGVITEFVSPQYYDDLEKYCDELEQRCLSDEWELTCLDKDCKKLEKALDKAGKFIDEFTQTCPKDMFDFDVRCDECDDDSKWCWKRWLMKDE